MEKAKTQKPAGKKKKKLIIPPLDKAKRVEIDMRQGQEANEDYQCPLCHSMLEYSSDTQWHCPNCTGECLK